MYDIHNKATRILVYVDIQKIYFSPDSEFDNEGRKSSTAAATGLTTLAALALTCDLMTGALAALASTCDSTTGALADVSIAGVSTGGSMADAFESTGPDGHKSSGRTGVP